MNEGEMATLKEFNQVLLNGEFQKKMISFSSFLDLLRLFHTSKWNSWGTLFPSLQIGENIFTEINVANSPIRGSKELQEFFNSLGYQIGWKEEMK